MMMPSQKSLQRHVLAVVTLGIILVGGLGGWAATATLSNAVIAEGTVVIDDNAKKIQHLTGGIVSEIAVKEGEHVKTGDLLLRLDGTAVESSLGIVDSTLAQLYARRARLKAELAGKTSFTSADVTAEAVNFDRNPSLIEGELQLFANRYSALVGMKKQLSERKKQLAEEIFGIGEQIKSIDNGLTIIEEEYKATNSLYSQQLVTMQRVNSLKRQRVELEGSRGERLAARAQAEGKISEIDLQILQLDEDRRTESAKELTQVESDIAQSEERQVALKDQLDRLELRAPMDGRIYQVTVHTVGGIVNPGDALMLLAPDARALTIEAKIATRNIDQIYPGQAVNLRFTAFDQRTTPEVAGTVATISPDAVTEQRSGVTYYPIRILPEEKDVKKLQGMTLYPGMPAEVFIKIAERSVISYLSKPLMDQINHTFREE